MIKKLIEKLKAFEGESNQYFNETFKTKHK
jgi:hypothetical protein